jgi:hypothetical protein
MILGIRRAALACYRARLTHWGFWTELGMNLKSYAAALALALAAVGGVGLPTL